MSRVWFSVVVATAAFWGTAVVKRSPYSYEVTPPVRQWADQPMKLVAVPLPTTTTTTTQQHHQWEGQDDEEEDDMFVTSAQHLAHLHNALIRGYNSIVLQAPHVLPPTETAADGGNDGNDDDDEDEDDDDDEDEDDDDDEDDEDPDEARHFIGYARTWVKFLRGHHDDEEAVLFPETASILHDNTLWGDMYKEHESLVEHIQALDAHLAHLSANASAYAPAPLLSLLSALRAPLEQNLHHEVAHLASLSAHPAVAPRYTVERAVAAETLLNWRANSVGAVAGGGGGLVGGTFDVVPLLLLNVDRGHNDGGNADWPPMLAPVRWALVNAVGAVHAGRWRFASCDAWGRPRELYAVGRAAERRRREQERETKKRGQEEL
ncbi:hypothetical protein JDV02_009167 [Purpureocillium takamizusanense]|uniref:Hemerythrin-like domain-containing protein n=1 Tax=Purpureocillium takamizusanense TaxID=2060973 RepID=A0A9Q8QRB0_9HYPO|nr:uncharacterized protein JDV02_009167 [Purpureocillium takamizusanense]UNI23339.1 hypothetical protein JDV02_009167 [Purpureocillium takamizusanense]